MRQLVLTATISLSTLSVMLPVAAGADGTGLYHVDRPAIACDKPRFTRALGKADPDTSPAALQALESGSCRVLRPEEHFRPVGRSGDFVLLQPVPAEPGHRNMFLQARRLFRDDETPPLGAHDDEPLPTPLLDPSGAAAAGFTVHPPRGRGRPPATNLPEPPLGSNGTAVADPLPQLAPIHTATDPAATAVQEQPLPPVAAPVASPTATSAAPPPAGPVGTGSVPPPASPEAAHSAATKSRSGNGAYETPAPADEVTDSPPARPAGADASLSHPANIPAPAPDSPPDALPSSGLLLAVVLAGFVLLVLLALALRGRTTRALRRPADPSGFFTQPDRPADVPRAAPRDVPAPSPDERRWQERAAPAGAPPSPIVREPAEHEPAIDGNAYRQRCLAALRQAGLQADPNFYGGRLTADILARVQNQLVAILCRPAARPLDQGAVEEAVIVRDALGARVAVVVSNAGFTRLARDIAGRSAIRLLHETELDMLTTAVLSPKAPSRA